METMSDAKPLKLHLGCGQKYLSGYVNIDYPPAEHTVMNVKADVYSDIRALRYENNSVDEIRAHHVFEHFSRAEALKMLFLWRRWLKPGGVLRLETPDFGKCALLYANSGFKYRMELGRHMLGSQEAKWAYHYDFWDKEKFRYVLRESGFVDIHTKQYANSFAQRFSFVPFGNIIGRLIPRFVYSLVGGHKLPNIEVTARKNTLEIDERKAAETILSLYLVGNEKKDLLDVWVNEVFA